MKFLLDMIYTALPPGSEKRFDDVTARQLLPHLRMGIMQCPIFVALSIAFDLHHFPASEALTLSIYLRAGFMLLFMGAFAITFWPRVVDFVYPLCSTVLLTGSLVIGSVIQLLDPANIPARMLLLIPFIAVSCVPALRTAAITVMLSAAILIAFLMKAGVTGGDLMAYIGVFSFLGMFVIMLVYSGVQQRRTAFIVAENLEKSKVEAESATRAKSEFLATMSHEVRTPLNGILGLMTLLKDTPLDAQQRDYVETVRYSGETLLTILNDILDFSKMDAGKLVLEPVVLSVERLMAGVVALLRGRAEEKKLKLTFSLGAGVPDYVRADATRMRQVLLNLVGNAIKFTASGSVTISVMPGAAPGRVRFSVEDTGVGISKEAQKKLFTEFAQADASVSRRYGGTGLGLAISRKIVELMGGKIGVTSETGKGSVFWFEIPLERADVTFISEEHAEEQDTVSLPPLSILVAEDNLVNQKVITGLLQKGGHTVTMASNGEEALARLDAPDSAYDLVLMDMQMPVLDGLAATGRIRQAPSRYKDIPVIALTANAVRGDEQRCLAAGMNGYVSKPVRPAALFREIGRCTGNTGGGKSATPAAAAAPAPDLDRKAVLENLASIEKLMGKDYMEGFINDGVRELSRLIGVIETGASGHNEETMRRAAHELKGMSAMFGFGGVQSLAEGIEMCCFEHKADEAITLSERLRESYVAGAEALRQTPFLQKQAG